MDVKNLLNMKILIFPLYVIKGCIGNINSCCTFYNIIYK